MPYMPNYKGLRAVAYWLMWIGAINWGLVGLFNLNLVESIFGGLQMIVTIIYVLVGLSALYMLFGKK